MNEKTGSGSLPQILIGDEPVGGYSDLVHLEATGELNQKLGEAEEGPVAPLYDVIIIGGGPAGLSAAIYTARKVLKTLLVSKDIGGQVAWTYDVDNYLGFSQVDTADLISKFEEHVQKCGVEKLVGAEVKAIELSGKIKKVITSDGKTYLTKTIVIATGKRPRPLNVPGEKELIGMGVTYCSTCDAPLFADLDVAVAGGGNSALEAVIDLMKVARKVYMVSLTPLTGDQILQDKVMSSPKVKVFTEYEFLRIVGESAVEAIEVASLKTGELKRLDVRGIIIEIGLLPNSELVVDTLETNRIGEIVIDARCRTGVAGVFACGDVTDVPFKQVIVAAGEGAKAALSAYDYIINQR
ncbi:MAG: FAD-dependent oxidoreductase [Deltaproteobacteria bacterium]|nr:FAD-dependent oxidoreductase [Deltaproteobacteria bacterium]MBW1793427.1 FAD-dependent oxidoreductase [Deltaproteobacteria bacterium]MBW2330047.1 FAD-dependent oxidoreductase [Deltaproteobacteria bacterium]